MGMGVVAGVGLVVGQSFAEINKIFDTLRIYNAYKGFHRVECGKAGNR
jgi:hypothetical protein